MPTEIFCRKDLAGRLVPDDDQSRERLARFRVGDPIRLQASKPRNYKYHQKFFALIEVVFENQEKYDSMEALRAELTMRAGWYEEHHHITGKVSYSPKSISFASMDQVEFEELFSKVIDVAIEYFLQGSTREEIEQAAMEVIGFA